MVHIALAALVLGQVHYAAAGSLSMNRMCPYNEGIGYNSDSIRVVFQDTHNNYRSKLAMGKQKNGPKKTAQYAMNMLEMWYYCDIEKDALAYARQCMEQPTVDSKYKANVMLVPVDGTEVTEEESAAKKAMKSWWEEFDKYGVKKMLYSQDVENAGEVVHATKMAWALNKQLGCATHKCDDNKYSIVCLYPARVNTVGKYVYSKSPNETDICAKCPKGNECDQETGLCYEE